MSTAIYHIGDIVIYQGTRYVTIIAAHPAVGWDWLVEWEDGEMMATGYAVNADLAQEAQA